MTTLVMNWLGSDVATDRVDTVLSNSRDPWGLNTH